MSRCHVPLCALALVALSACGPNSHPLRGERKDPTPAPRPALELAQPILRFVPASSQLVVVVPGLEELLVAAEALEPIARREPQAAQWLDGLQANIGIVGQSESWTRFGIVPGAALALFSDGQSSTLLVPLAPDAPWQDLPALIGASDSQFLSDPQGDVLALRWSLDTATDSAIWTGEMQGAATGVSYAAGSQAQEAFRFARGYADAGASGHEEIWGHYDLARGLQQSGFPCAALAADLQGIHLHARAQPGETQVHAELSLTGGDVAALRALLGPRASRGMQTLREQEGLSASLRVDVGALTNALRRSRCELLADPLRRSLEELGFAPTAVHLAGSRFDPSELSGKLAVDIGLVEKRFFKSQLDQVPGRSLFESTIHIAGQRLVKLGVPLMSTLYYQLTEHRFLFSTHKSMMAELLGEPGDDSELLFLQVVPGRLPQLTQMLAMAMPRQEAQALAALAREFELLRAEVQLKDTRLQMHLQLRVPPHSLSRSAGP